jgi:dihydroneopterin aldolase
MLTVSLHGIRILAPYGLYPEEKLTPNEFLIDVDIWLPHNNVEPWPFVDYTLVNNIVQDAFKKPAELIEELVQRIHNTLRNQIHQAERIRVCIKKMHPPMEADVAYAQVCYEA